MDYKIFTVTPMRSEDVNKAKILESVINHPRFVQNVMDGVDKLVKEFYLDNLLFGTPIDKEKFDARMNEIVKEQNKNGL